MAKTSVTFSEKRPRVRYATTNRSRGYVIVRCVPRDILPFGDTYDVGSLIDCVRAIPIDIAPEVNTSGV